jgi:hypothetical protein
LLLTKVAVLLLPLCYVAETTINIYNSAPVASNTSHSALASSNTSMVLIGSDPGVTIPILTYWITVLPADNIARVIVNDTIITTASLPLMVRYLSSSFYRRSLTDINALTIGTQWRSEDMGTICILTHVCVLFLFNLFLTLHNHTVVYVV